ncbi:hypothetical protein O181_058168 [Austropuccinia psidii MF-1]|uniref:DNA-directed RNA polymerase III subunit n=1 Tax=Austropuccinia psidii MF-1 TaxID=1389203 RepID=A0A9Q3HV75_9BASI|nr:hypothetical protein [Austropuccinia psidii MF-1]
MKAVDEALKVTSKARIRKLPREPQMTNFMKVPMGLPLDFYSMKWLNRLPVTQQRMTVNANEVAFLPDPMKSLLPPKHKDHDVRERWSDRKFTKEFIGVKQEEYGFNDVEVDSEGEVVVVDDEEEVEGGVIDLEEESEDDGESEKYLEDGEWGRVYDEEEDKDYNGEEDDEDRESTDEEEEEAEMSDLDEEMGGEE